jgi:hypothetical protein
MSDAQRPQKRPTRSDSPATKDRKNNPPEEFGRFEGLTRKLFKVPKSELDEKRQKDS